MKCYSQSLCSSPLMWGYLLHDREKERWETGGSKGQEIMLPVFEQLSVDLGKKVYLKIPAVVAGMLELGEDVCPYCHEETEIQAGKVHPGLLMHHRHSP